MQNLNNKIKIHFLNRRPKSINPIKLIQFNINIFRIQPDILHFHDHNGIRLILKKGKAKTFLTIHGLKNPKKYFSRYDKLISISKAVKNDLIAKGPHNSTLIYNGVDFSKIAIKETFSPFNVFKIVEVGRLNHEIKGQDILLKALHFLLTSKGIKNFSLDFIGEGPSLKYLQELTQTLKLENFVNFKGLKTRKEIYQMLSNYHLLIQPSRTEGFGLTIVEAMAAKIPVIVSNIEGPIEIIENGEYGTCFIAGNHISCANAIENVINNFYVSDYLGYLNKTYKYASTHFSVQQTSREYLKCYKNQLSSF